MLHYFIIILSLLIFTCSLLTILSKNPVHSILFLILVFIETTIILIVLNVEFIAMLFLVVYVGAITVLFLFVVMMLNVKIVELDERFIKYIPIGAIMGIVFILELIFLLNQTLTNYKNYNFIIENTILDIINDTTLSYSPYYQISINTNLEQIANILFNKYPYIFILAGMILLIAMLGAITLTLNQQQRIKKQDYYLQTNKKINDSIRYLK